MAVTAANGGVLGWQAGWATPFERFQFVLGRELAIVAYGLTAVGQMIVSPGAKAALLRCAGGAWKRASRLPALLIGYSKGAPDILESVVKYPEIRSRVAAVVSAAGAVGGSALANDAEQYQADLLRHFPGATCGSGDGGAVESLRPAARQAWLAKNPLPADVRYYSLVTFPQPERISSILKTSYEKLAQIDARNDSQVIFYDQVVPAAPSSAISMRTLGSRGADQPHAQHDRLDVRDPECLPAAEPLHGGAPVHALKGVNAWYILRSMSFLSGRCSSQRSSGSCSPTRLATGWEN